MGLPWASGCVLIPLLGAVICGAVTRRRAHDVGLVGTAATAICVVGLIWRVATEGPVVEPLGGWNAPVGIELYADGFSALMVAMTGVVAVCVSLFSVGHFAGSPQPEKPGGRHEGYYWAVWLTVWAALNGVFVSADLFNIYVCIEMMGIGSVALVALAGSRALRAALRYLLVTLTGSLLYLLGVALLYGGWEIVALREIGEIVVASPASETALVVMTVGLVLKSALLPLHFWLPKAHANAPSPVSAVMSALVVKASVYVLIRLWNDVFAGMDTDAVARVVGVLGAAAIVWGSIQALRQSRLKMLVAYSTVAQIGYLFLAFIPAISSRGDDLIWQGAVYFAVSHGCSKGAMFLSAGVISAMLGSDEFSMMQGKTTELAVPLFAFGLAGVGLIGLPPSGGFVGKWLMLTAAIRAEMPLVAAMVMLAQLRLWTWSCSSSRTAPAVTLVSKPCSSIVAPTMTSPSVRGASNFIRNETRTPDPTGTPVGREAERPRASRRCRRRA